MSNKIKSALISVSDKTGLIELARFLESQGILILSTGGTAKHLRDEGIEIKDVSDYTGFPEIMDGRVKTLHPKIHGGLLQVRTDKKHQEQAEKNKIPPIDMVVVNLYPFEETVRKGAKFSDCIENIDIGGPSMVRSAAKNHEFVTVVVDPDDYKAIVEEMKASGGVVSNETKRKLAAKAFSRTAAYDSAISQWFAGEIDEKFPTTFAFSGIRKEVMRYGENPHQKAALYTSKGKGIATAKQLQGKELSYNNICDADAAMELISEFSEPACVIIKHANPCGVATDKSLTKAYEKALACDPVSAYGSIIAFNREIDKETAETLSKLFVEVIIAPKVSKAAEEIFAKKKNMRLLVEEIPDKARKEFLVRNVSGGFLLQERDAENISEGDLKIVTERKPTNKEVADMLFAWTVCKHTKSNAIVFAKDNMAVGVGAGQMSRVDSVKIATMKAKEHKHSVEGCVMASDAFLPFADGLILAAEAGIKAVIQPGGSIRDEEVIKAANEHGVAMVFTGKRHFRH